MSRSSLQRGFNAADLDVAVAAPCAERREDSLPQHGSQVTYNLESVLKSNAVASRYYQGSAKALESADEVLDEALGSVEHVEPWMSGNARGPSTAFCLLFRLGQLRPTGAEVKRFLTTRDAPLVRALGLLYLRYTLPPRELWKWFEALTKDRTTFSPSPAGLGREVTIGEFARDILLDQFYFETLFPRMPRPVEDEVKAKLREAGLPDVARGNGGQGGPDRRGSEQASARPASVKASLSVAVGQRAPNRSGALEAGRGLAADQRLSGTDRGPRPPRQDGGRGRAPSLSRSPPRRSRGFRSLSPPERRPRSRENASPHRAPYGSRRSRSPPYGSRRSRSPPYGSRRSRSPPYGSRRSRSPYGSRRSRSPYHPDSRTGSPYGRRPSRSSPSPAPPPSSSRDRWRKGVDVDRDRRPPWRGDHGDGRDDRGRRPGSPRRRSRSPTPPRRPGRDVRDVFRSRAL